MPSPGQLALRDLRFSYESAAWELRIPALALGREPLCGIVGPNGSGKSTLLKLAAGLLAPGAGAVELDGRALARMRRLDVARHLGFLPQECPALFNYTVEQVVALGRHAHGGGLDLPNAADREAVARALGDVGLETLRHRPLSHLSGGERRRAWIASALAQEPEILLLDEPTQSLDVHQAAVVMEILARRAANGLRVVAVMHDLNLAGLFCDRLILLQTGEIAAEGLPAEILTENRLFSAYGDKIEVLRRPESQNPIVLAKK
ncbi:MAG: ABC transporter ATP-binding protein [Kiritimatiellia bacterium]